MVRATSETGYRIVQGLSLWMAAGDLWVFILMIVFNAAWTPSSSFLPLLLLILLMVEM